MNNLIFEIQRFAQIYGTDSDDNIVNDRDNVTINALAGNDTVDNMGSTVAVYGGTGNDSLNNHGNNNSNRITNVTLDGGAGDDRIETRYANYVLIDGGAGDDYLYFDYSENATINGGEGNDAIYDVYKSNNITIDGGQGDDHIRNLSSNISINGGADNDYIYTSGDTVPTENVTIIGGEGNDTIYNYKSNNVTIDGGYGDDSIRNYGNNVLIYGGAGSNNISIGSSTSVTAYGGDGDDTISVYQSNKLYIHGGAGNDLISVIGSNADNINTIAGGEGDDTITGGRGLHLYQYTEGDGNDIITDFKANDTLQIGNGTDTYNSIKSGSDIIVTVGDGSVTLKDAAGLSAVNIAGTYVDPLLRIGTDGDDYIVNSLDGATILALGGNDSITNNGSNVLIDAGEDDDSVSIGYWDNKSVGSNVTVNLGVGDDYFSNYGFQKISVSGGAGNDYIDNNALSGVEYITPDNSTLLGGAGDDTIINAGVNTSISGGTGDDYINNWGNDVIIDSGEGNDYIESYGFNSTLDGGDGDDTISNKYNDNSFIDGGAGNDSIYSDDGDHSTINSGAGNDSIRLGSYASNNLIQYTSGDGNDIITDFKANDTLQIGNGTDTYNSIKSGSDIIVTVGDGDVTLTGAANLSTVNIAGTYVDPLLIIGTDYADTISNRLDNATIQALGGDDYIDNSGNNVSVNGGDGNDLINNYKYNEYEGASNVTINGGAGDDIIDNIDSGKDNVIIDGSDGNDTIENDASNVTINGGAGDDYVSSYGSVEYHYGYNIVIDGGDGNDTINSWSDDVTINGGDGDDSIILDSDSKYNLIQYTEGDGNDIVRGFNATSTLQIGDGYDTYSPVVSGNNLIVNVGDGSITLKGAGGLSTVNIIGIINNTINNAFISGTSNADTISNSGNNVTIQALGGDDYIDNSGDNVSINGGTGDDYIYSFDEDYSTINGGDGNDTIQGNYWSSSLNGGSGNDSINVLGGGYYNSINGGDGDDYIFNNASHASIVGGAGDDAIYNNASYASINAGDGDDSVSIGYWDNKSVESNVTVNLGVGDDYFYNHGFQKISVSGGDGNDYINNALSGVEDITPDNSTLLGGAGNDFIYNTGVNASISGGTGDDYIYNWGNDVIIDSGEGNDYIYNYGYNSFIDGGAGDDYIDNWGNDVIIDGGAGGDDIYNIGSNVTINGGDGSDSISNSNRVIWNSETSTYETITPDFATIIGGKGHDKIFNGGENVLFKYSAGDGNDIVYGFNATSTLQIGDGTGEFGSVISGSDIIVTVSDGSVTLKDAASLSTLNIAGTEISTVEPTISPTITTLYLDDSDKSPVTLSTDYQNTDASARVKKAIKITGNALDNSIIGGAKNDSLVGKDGNDTIIGGLGNDTFIGGNGNDLFVYTAGNDVVTDYVSGEDTIKFESAITNVSVKSSDVIFTTDDGKLTVKNSDDKIINYIDVGGNSSVYPDTTDTISVSLNSAKTAAEIFECYNENIFYASNYSTKIKSIDASATTHDLEIFANEKNASKIIGGDGDNILHGSTKNDTFTGGIGNDTFVYSGGNDTITDYTEDEDIIDIESGAIYDKASVKGNDVIFTVGKNKITVKDSADKTITFSDGTTWDGSGCSGVTSVTLTNSDPSPYILGSKIETVENKRTKAIEIFGNDLANSIFGGSKNDSIYGGDDDDTLDGARGNDTLTGGDGYDLFIYTAGKDVITDYTEDEDIISLAAGTIKTASAEGSNVVFKIGSGTLTVNDAAGKTLSMIDADGNEFSTVIGGGVDTLKIVTNDDPDLVKLAFEVEVVDATKRTKYDVSIEGNAQDNSIVGGSKNDSLYGAAGDDTLDGGKGKKGNDTLTGGDGNDVFVYTAGNDVITDYETGDKISTGTIKNASAEGDDVVFKIGSGTLTVNDAAGKTLSMIDAKGNEYSMIIGGSEETVSLNAAGTAVKIFEGYTADSFDAADYGSKLKTIDGSATTHDFEIIGNGLANSIIGGSGDNILIGGLGNDKLWGEAGNDSFIYEDGDGKDVIYGFENGDLLQIMGDFSAKFNKSKNEIAFKVGTTSNAITLKEFDATTFNINGDSYQISGTNLVKK